MAKIVWDRTGERFYETGVEKPVLYPMVANAYTTGVAWNGFISCSESPSGAEPSPIYANNKKYVVLVSNEEFDATVEAYTYPDEFAKCDGSFQVMEGVSFGQQARQMFGLSYQTNIGNDTEFDTFGKKIHIIYGCLAAPSEKSYTTISDAPEAITFSWEISTTPVEVAEKVDGKTAKPIATMVFDSTKMSAAAWTVLEDTLYGTADTEGTLPLPDALLTILRAAG